MKQVFLVVTVFFASICNAGAQAIKEFVIERLPNETAVASIACGSTSLGVVVFKSVIPDLLFRLDQPSKLIRTFHDLQRNEYVLCVEATDRKYSITITHSEFAATEFFVENIAANTSQIFTINAKQLGGVPVTGILVSKNRTIYLNQRALSNNEVRALMINSREAVQLYNKGLLRNRNGNILFFAGLATIAGGVVYIATQPDFVEKRHEYTGADGNQYYRYQDEKVDKTLGTGLAVAGGVMMISGISLKITSKTLVQKSANAYNRQNIGAYMPNRELNIGFTGNGVCLILNF